MGLFKPDLFRSFALSFVLGTAALLASLAATSGKGLGNQMIPAAQAAPVALDQTR